MLIIGITGTIGSGKGTVVEYLIQHYGFIHYSVRKYLTNILMEQGIQPNRDNFTTLANKLRANNNSASYLIEQLYLQAKTNGQNAIIESIRTVGEIDELKKIGKFYLLAVDADQKLRYNRIYQRKSETDSISYEKFVFDEEREMNSTDPNNQNISACIQRADYQIINNSGLSELHQQIDKVLQQINQHES